MPLWLAPLSGCTDTRVAELMLGVPRGWLCRFEYHWADGGQYRKPTSLPAPKYIALLMDWVESLINDEALFPPDPDTPFPKTFMVGRECTAVSIIIPAAPPPFLVFVAH